MKIAAIDIGTNSIRTIIAEIRGDATFQVIDQLKDMVRLGEGETAESGLTARAIADGLAALVKARAICDAHQVEQIITLATSAVREARNGGTFVELVEQETGLVVNVITAEEEARLIYLGARESARLDDRDALLIDIGGGSVELIIGNSSRIKYTTSLKLGVLRLLNRFPISDPPKSKEMDAVQAYVLQSLSRVAPRLREIGFQNVFVTSGTNLTLLSLALQHDQKEGVTTSSLNNQTISANKLASVCKWLMKSSLAERRHAGRIQPGRLDSIVMGAVLVQCLLSELRIKEVTGSSFALREGILVDYLYRHLPQIRDQEKYPDRRRRSVLALAQRCNWEHPHSQHVSTLALSLYDQLADLHQLHPQAREWLEYASLLHDIGYHINARSHHKHGAYLVLNGDLLGFTQVEIQIISAVVRYHRKHNPARTDPELNGLNAAQRRAVEILAGILRIADGLDRTHFGIVQRVVVTPGGKAIDVRVFAKGDAELEIWFASRKSGLLETALGKKLQLVLVANLSTPPGIAGEVLPQSDGTSSAEIGTPRRNGAQAGKETPV